MSKHAQYEEAKEVLAEIRHELENESLTDEQRKELEIHAAGLSGFLLHPWLPVSWPRRLIMSAIVLFGIQQAWIGNYEPLIWWVLLPFFSPRVVGECAFFLGRIKRLILGR